MLRALLMTVVFSVPSCSKSDQPNTRYWATDESFAKRMQAICLHGAAGDIRTRWDGSLPESVQEFSSERCALQSQSGDRAGFATVVMQGSRDSTDYKSGPARNGFCAVHIGPTPIAAPLVPDLIFSFVEDPVLSKKLRLLVDGLDPKRAFQVSATVDGVHVEVEQWNSLFDGPTVELRVDSCARALPDAQLPVHKIGESLAFASQIPHDLH